LEPPKAGLSKAIAAGLIAVGVIIGSFGYYIITTYQNVAMVETQTEETTLTAISRVTVPTTVTEMIMSVSTQTEYSRSALSTSLTLVPPITYADEIVTLAGDGLPANTSLYLADCSNGITYAQFTTNSAGAVPSGVTFVFPHMANPGPETGALVTWQIDDSRECGQGNNPIGTVKVLYGATMTLVNPVGPAGSTVTVSAAGLVASGIYDVVFNYTQFSTNPSAYQGTVVGVILADDVGDGTANITVPASAAMGLYNIGLVSTHNVDTMIPANVSVLRVIPVFTV